MRRPARYSIAPLALALAACASNTDSGSFMPGPPGPARPADHPIRIFRAQLPACAFDEVGFVTWVPRHGFDTLEKGLESMRRHARELGGDAIIDFSYPNTSSTTNATTGDRDETLRAVGTVIRYADAKACATAAQTVRDTLR
jgi:hypothetical protein